MSSKKEVKLLSVSEWRLYILTCSMQKYFTFYQSLQANFPILLIKYLLSRPISDYISSRDQILKKSLSTFQPFTYVSNERYLINEMCIEGFSQRLESRIDQFWHLCQRSWRNCQKLWYSLGSERLINDRTNENASHSVISCPTQRWCSAFTFWLNQFIPVHFYALASHCIYILSCWKIEAYNVLVKFTFCSSHSKWGCCNWFHILGGCTDMEKESNLSSFGTPLMCPRTSLPDVLRM